MINIIHCWIIVHSYGIHCHSLWHLGHVCTGELKNIESEMILNILEYHHKTLTWIQCSLLLALCILYIIWSSPQHSLHFIHHALVRKWRPNRFMLCSVAIRQQIWNLTLYFWFQSSWYSGMQPLQITVCQW